jgi:hypothetical protein
MKDPTDEGFYVILKTVTGQPDARTDEIVEPGVKGLRTADVRAAILNEALTKEERKRGVRYYTTTFPVGRRN